MSLVNGYKNKGIHLDKTMPLQHKNTEKTTKKALRTFSIRTRKDIIKTDQQYIQNIKTDRVASYTYIDKANISRIEKGKLKVRKEISEPSVMTSEEISDITCCNF